MFRKCIILKKVFQNFHYLLNCNSIFRLLDEEGERQTAPDLNLQFARTLLFILFSFLWSSNQFYQKYIQVNKIILK